MAFHIIIAAALTGAPVVDLQGDWNVMEVRVREPGEQGCWKGLAFEPGENTWQVRGTSIEAVFSEKRVRKRVALLPSLVPEKTGPTELRFTDYDGLVYSGSYAVKDGKAVLTLQAWVPIPGMPDTQGVKDLTIKLERPKPQLPKPGIRAFDRPGD